MISKKDTEIRFVGLIRQILDRPAMFDVNNIEDLALLIQGFKMGQIPNQFVADLMSEFGVYLNKEFGCKEEAGWARLIRFYSSGDSGSLFLFDKHFFEFLKFGGN